MHRINLTRRQLLRRLHLLLVTMFLLWLGYSTRAQGFDKQILSGDHAVQVTEGDHFWRFAPQTLPTTTALLFIPGALVEPTAYAPLAQRLAEKGTAVYIIKPPWFSVPLPGQEAHIARFVQDVVREETAVTQWFIGGHSRGGAIAGRFVRAQPNLVKGLILLGTSHPKEAAYDLSHLSMPVMKIYASEDGLASVGEVVQNQVYLPKQTQYLLIEGGNHAQFGWYGAQLGDQRALIGREAQQAQVVAAILTMINRTP